jgi:DnaK suppressor protein
MARKMRRSGVPTMEHLQGGGTTGRPGLEALLRVRRGALEPPKAPGTASADPIDAAQARAEERTWLAIVERTRDMQAMADEALARLDAGRYGVCAECEEPIPALRLRALPFAVRCLPCQERCERRAEARNAAAPRPDEHALRSLPSNRWSSAEVPPSRDGTHWAAYSE